MKKILFIPLFLFSVACFAKSGSSEVFTYDEQEVTRELAALSSLETSISARQQNTGANEIIHSDAQLLKAMNMQAADNQVLGIPSFIWGCGAGITGVAIVYFVAEDKEETKKALKGCVVNGVVIGLIYVLAIAGSTAAAASAY